MLMVREKANLSLCLMLIVVASGCISSQNSSNSVPLEDLSSNPSEYLGQEVIVKGEIKRTGSDRGADDGWKIGTTDGEISLSKPNDSCKVSDYASSVKIQGAVKKYDTCDCRRNETLLQSTNYIINEKTPYDEEDVEKGYYITEGNDIEINYCERLSNGSINTGQNYVGCRPESKQTKYYISCNRIEEEYE